MLTIRAKAYSSSGSVV